MKVKEMVAQVRALKHGESKSDAEAFEELATLVEKGDWKGASKRYRQMDTYNREAISTNLSTEIRSRGAGSRFIVTASVKLEGYKKVFKKGFGPGVVATIDLEFPGDTSKEHMAIGVAQQSHEIIDQIVKVVFSEPRREKVL